MTDSDLTLLKDWFSTFTKTFHSDNDEDQKNIMLKIEHSKCVRKNIVEIAKGEGFSDNETRIAEAIGLLHDIGRFPQYAQYRTFRDADSENHGLLGYKVLTENNVLVKIQEHERELILAAVKFHGVFSIPSSLNKESIFYLKLIRDADKIDIYRVFIEYYEAPPEKRASATAFGVPDLPEYSKKMLSNIMHKRIASYSDIRTENDFRLMKLSWLFDMNFDSSLRLLNERGYIERLMRMMPDTDEINNALDSIMEYVSSRLKN